MILSVCAIISATYTFLLANCKGCILRNEWKLFLIPSSYGGSEQADKVIDLFFHVADLRSSKTCPRTLNYGKSPYSVHALLVHKHSLTLQSPSFPSKFILFLTGKVPPYMIQNYMTTFTTDMVCAKRIIVSTILVKCI